MTDHEASRIRTQLARLKALNIGEVLILSVLVALELAVIC